MDEGAVTILPKADVAVAEQVHPCLQQMFIRNDAPARDNFDKFDEFETGLSASQHTVELPLKHDFVPGMYIRTIYMPAGTLLTSKIHMTEHPFVITKGCACVWIDNVGWQELRAPYTGITLPNTRRVLYIKEDCTWTTFHATTLTDVDEIEKMIIEPRKDHLITQAKHAEIGG